MITELNPPRVSCGSPQEAAASETAAGGSCIQPYAHPAVDVDRLIEFTLATCASRHTRRSYRIQLLKFFASGLPLNREGVALHIQRLRDANVSGSTLLATNAAIRKLAQEAVIRRLMTEWEYQQICTVKTGKLKPSKAGTWLTPAQVSELLSKPDRESFWGCRDACILAILTGCGLRRAEMTGVAWSQYQMRDGRPCLVDILGKGSKYRTLPVPQWAVPDIERWQKRSQVETPPRAFEHTRHIIHPANYFDRTLITGGLGESGVANCVADYGNEVGLHISPHDLRRTLAQMLRKAGAPLEQIQYTLGHSSIETTVIYLGSKLELAPGVAAVDMVQLMPPNPAVRMGIVDRVTMALEAERQDIEAREYARKLAEQEAEEDE